MIHKACILNPKRYVWAAPLLRRLVLNQTPWPVVLLPAFLPLPLSFCGAWRQGRVCQFLGYVNVLHLYIANLCKIQQKRTNTAHHLQSELTLKEPFTWLFLCLFGMKVFTGRESCFKRHKVTPLGALLSEIASKENNRSYSVRLWAQGQK